MFRGSKDLKTNKRKLRRDTMNRSIFAAGFLALMGCLSLGAQTISLQASIPFEFRVGQTLMPPGEYMITHSQGVLWFKTYTAKPKAVNILVQGTTKGVNGGKSNHLLFNRYGENYFLSRVYQVGHTSGLAVPPGKTERELIASQAGPIQSATVNLRAAR
jgi:hypothetical protein